MLVAAVLSSLALPTRAQEPAFKAYQNYDFIPGQKILFEDDFRADADGEFPTHSDLVKGPALINEIAGEPAFLLTDGTYVMVKPGVKVEQYLTDPFTAEFDYLVKAAGYNPILTLVDEEASTTPEGKANDRRVEFVTL